MTWDNHAGETLVKVVPLRHLPEAISNGVGFSPVSDAFRSDGVIDGAHRLARPDGDLRLRADLESLAMLEPQLGWAWAAGERWDRNSGPYAADQRHFCRRMEAALADSGWRLRAGFELEWVVVVPLSRRNSPSRSSGWALRRRSVDRGLGLRLSSAEGPR